MFPVAYVPVSNRPPSVMIANTLTKQRITFTYTSPASANLAGHAVSQSLYKPESSLYTTEFGSIRTSNGYGG